MKRSKVPQIPEIKLRRLPSGKMTYFLLYYDLGGNRIRLSAGSNKEAAVKFAHQVYEQLKAEYFGEEKPPEKKADISELIEAFIRSKHGRTSASTIKRYRILARNFQAFLAMFDQSKVDANRVTRTILEQSLEHLQGKGHKPRTLNAQLQFLKALFKFAVDEGYLTTSPAQRIKPFRETKRAERVPFWNRDEVQQILAELKPHYRDAFEFLFNTGLRKGEMMNLTWADVDLNPEHPAIVIRAKSDWTPKTLSVRTIPLNQRAVELIRKQPRSTDNNYVFKAREGGQLHHDRFYKDLKRALGKLGLQGDVHKFRHTFASHLVIAGVGIETVSKLLGHTTIEMTMKYAHLAPDHLRKAVELLNGGNIKPTDDTQTT